MSQNAIKCLGELSSRLSFTELTKVQERVIPALFTTGNNIVVAAPTGSGKTLLLEVAMLHLFKDFFLSISQRSSVSGNGDQRNMENLFTGKKAVYICPIKALANEKYNLWKEKFHPLSVVIETGDQEKSREEQNSLASVSTADIIVTTPERWDSITRRWKEKTVMSIVHSVGLILLDEIHTVHEERGAALEAIVSRMMAIKGSASQSVCEDVTSASGLEESVVAQGGSLAVQSVRFVAISGTLPNIKDFAQWLHVRKDMFFSFSNSDRPVPLTVHINGFSNGSNNPFSFDRFLTFKLYNTVRQYSEGKPTMIFCTSRKEVVHSALKLVEEIKLTAEKEGRLLELNPSPEVQALANQANDKQLKSCLLYGFAFHHAALSLSDRLLVEEMFKNQYIAVICTTTTLALGVNLPAHLVIIKGTSFFKNGNREDIPLSEMAQMCGRAGRPGHDAHGVAVVLTTDNKVKHYQCLQKGDVYSVVESQLHRHMIEHVNAEVALRTINSFASALDWVRTTFFWIRLKLEPKNYGIVFKNPEEKMRFDPEVYIERLLEKVLLVLEKEECVTFKYKNVMTCPAEVLNGEEIVSPSKTIAGTIQDRLKTDDVVIETTRIGKSMARLYILFGTVQVFNEERRSRGSKVAVIESNNHLSNDEGKEDVQNIEAVQDLTEASEDTKEKNSLDTADNTGQMTELDEEEPHDLYKSALGPVGKEKKPYRLQHLLRLVCQSDELTDIRLRQGDRGPLNELNKNVKFPLKEGYKRGREVREDWHKAYILIQSQLGQHQINDISIRNDFIRLWAVVPRVVRFLVEYAWCFGSYSMALHAVSLLRCVEQRMWNDGHLLRQLEGVGDHIAKLVAGGGFHSFEQILSADPRKLEVLSSRLPPFGSNLLRQVQCIPKCVVEVEKNSTPGRTDRRTGLLYSVKLSADNACLNVFREVLSSSEEREIPFKVTKIKRMINTSSYLLLVGHVDTDHILLQRYVPISSLYQTANGVSNNTVSSFSFLLPPQFAAEGVRIHVLTQHFIGNDTIVQVMKDVRPSGEVEINGNSSHKLNSKFSAVKTRTKWEKGSGLRDSTTSGPQVIKAKKDEMSRGDSKNYDLKGIVEEGKNAFTDLLEDFKHVENDGSQGAETPRTPLSLKRKKVEESHSKRKKTDVLDQMTTSEQTVSKRLRWEEDDTSSSAKGIHSDRNSCKNESSVFHSAARDTAEEPVDVLSLTKIACISPTADAATISSSLPTPSKAPRPIKLQERDSPEPQPDAFNPHYYAQPTFQPMQEFNYTHPQYAEANRDMNANGMLVQPDYQMDPFYGNRSCAYTNTGGARQFFEPYQNNGYDYQTGTSGLPHRVPPDFNRPNCTGAIPEQYRDTNGWLPPQDVRCGNGASMRNETLNEAAVARGPYTQQMNEPKKFHFQVRTNYQNAPTPSRYGPTSNTHFMPNPPSRMANNYSGSEFPSQNALPPNFSGTPVPFNPVAQQYFSSNNVPQRFEKSPYGQYLQRKNAASSYYPIHITNKSEIARYNQGVNPYGATSNVSLNQERYHSRMHSSMTMNSPSFDNNSFADSYANEYRGAGGDVLTSNPEFNASNFESNRNNYASAAPQFNSFNNSSPYANGGMHVPENIAYTRTNPAQWNSNISAAPGMVPSFTNAENISRNCSQMGNSSAFVPNSSRPQRSTNSRKPGANHVPMANFDAIKKSWW